MKRKWFYLIALLLPFITSCSTDDDGTTIVVPAAPGNLTATVISTTQVNLSWTDNSTNESGYKVQRKTGGGNFADVATTGPDIITYSNTGLTPNTTYTYRVYAYNSAGNSHQYSNEVTVTTNLIPIITTAPISDTAAASVTCGGNITSDAGSPVTARGVCWSTSSGPTVALSTKTADGTGTGSFTSNITGLTANTTYYVRAYATNANGTAYGNEVIFTTTAIDITTGLVGYWPFNGNANDESGNGNNGTVMLGASINSDRNGNVNSAYYFDGFDGLNKGISLPLSLNGLEYSTNIWFQIMDTVKAGQNSSQTIFVIKPFGVFATSYNHPYAPGKMMSCLGDSLDWRICAPGNPNSWNLSDKLNWHNLTTVKTPTEYKYFIDGILVRAQPITSNFNVPISKIYIGAIQLSSGEVFRGKLDDFRVYNRVLTQAEITYLATH